jgi:hypothetical protein
MLTREVPFIFLQIEWLQQAFYLPAQSTLSWYCIKFSILEMNLDKINMFKPSVSSRNMYDIEHLINSKNMLLILGLLINIFIKFIVSPPPNHIKRRIKWQREENISILDKSLTILFNHMWFLLARNMKVQCAFTTTISISNLSQRCNIWKCKAKCNLLSYLLFDYW